ncbi:MAG TPA: phosphopentomutase, partial [Gemmatimonadaceae bacterium]|nr:phosphopentomutase [Gemmatimonadaceae bacterium]
MTRAAIIVLDGVGAGAAPDAADYGDEGSDTLGNLARAVGGMHLPSLQALGLGNALRLLGVPPSEAPWAAWGTMRPRSPGKDSTTGHWEIAGIVLERPFPTYPDGFPADLVDAFARATGRSVIGNVAASGTEIIARLGQESVRRGAWIVYTSADSVFQIAAHEGAVPLEELYAACRTARALLAAPHDVSRVIARPFEGEPGAYRRTPNRRDFSLEPPAETLLDALASAGIARRGVGKVDDLFAGRGISAEHVAGNAEGVAAVRRALDEMDGGLLFANLVDFDQRWGHRNDVPGFYGGLRELDAALPALLAHLREDDLLFLTA